MEIALLPKNAVRIKSKHTTLVVDPVDAATPYQGALFLMASGKTTADGVAISGPGEYEVGGIKISGIRSSLGQVYSLHIDDIDLLLGPLPAVEKLQHKLKEHNLVLLQTEAEADASFVTSLATNGILMYGVMAGTVIGKFAKEGMTQQAKYQVTKDKLPVEIQTILLQ